MRERIKQILEWLHATLLFPILIPAAYTLGDIKGAEYGYFLYFKCFIIAIPVVVTGVASQKCKSLFAYMGYAILSVAACMSLAWTLQPSEYGFVYVFLLGLECLFLAGKRFMDRLRTAKDRQEQDNDPFWQPRFSVLNKPSFGTLGYFVVWYLLGVCFMSKVVCDEAFFTALVYVFIVILHVFLVETEDYLKLNRRVSGLPARRIYGIAGGMLGLFMVLLFLVAIPSILTIPLRQYTDIRTWYDGQITVMPETEIGAYLEEKPASGDMSMMLEGMAEEPGKLPVWIEALFYGIFAVVIGAVIMMMMKEIRKIFSDFRETYDENGDKIEVLEEEEAVTRMKRGNDEAEDSEARNIRKKYRKMIRKHRKDKPAVYESPMEIEEHAGLLENEEMRKLHVEYEAVRYGK